MSGKNEPNFGGGALLKVVLNYVLDFTFKLIFCVLMVFADFPSIKLVNSSHGKEKHTHKDLPSL